MVFGSFFWPMEHPNKDAVGLVRIHPNHVMLMITSEIVFDRYSAAGKEPDFDRAEPEWTAQFGPEGRPRNILMEKNEGEQFGFTFEYSHEFDQHMARAPLRRCFF